MDRIRRCVIIASAVLVVLAVASPGVAQPPHGPVINPPTGAIPGQPAVPPGSPQQPTPLLDMPPALGCQTQWGICRVPCCIPPGRICYCGGANNTALPGYAVRLFRPTP